MNANDTKNKNATECNTLPEVMLVPIRLVLGSFLSRQVSVSSDVFYVPSNFIFV